MTKEKLNKLNVKLETELDEDIIEILDKVQNKTLFTKTAIRLAYQQMVEDVSIAKVREPALYRSERFMKDVEDFKNNSISAPVDKDNSSISSNSNDTHGTGLESKDDVISAKLTIENLYNKYKNYFDSMDQLSFEFALKVLKKDK